MAKSHMLNTKHLLWALLCLLLGVDGAYAQATFGAQFTGSSTGSPSTIAINITGVSTGDLLVCLVRDRDGNNPTGASDSTNGSWTTGPTVTGAGENRTASFYKINSASGTIAVTISWGIASVANANCQRYSITGTATLDQSTTRTAATGTSHSSGSITTASGNVLMISSITAASDPGTWTVDSDYTALTDPTRSAMAYRIGSGPITDTATASSTNSVATVGIHFSFSISGGGGGGANCCGGAMKRIVY